MLTLILASLLQTSAASPSVRPVEAPSTRRVCRNVPIPNSRFTRRICNDVADKRPAPEQPPAAPPAPEITTLSVGMSVVDSQGGAVGTITAIAADSVTVKTAKHQAQLPRTSLAISDGKALLGMTQVELDASVEQAEATVRQAAFKVGATVKGKGEVVIGTIAAVEGDNVTIALASGVRINIPRSGITATPDGGGVIGLSAAELEAQVKAASPAR